MTRQEQQGESQAGPTAEAQRLAGVVLLRISTEPAPEQAVGRDILPLLGPKTAPEIWRIELGRLVAAMIAGGLVERHGDNLRSTPLGNLAAAEFLGARKGLPPNWVAARDVALPAKALGLEAGPQSRLKLLAKSDGLKALIVIHHWNLKIKGSPTPSRLRSALAVKALERAFGNQIRSGLGDKSALPAKAGRLLAGQLSSSTRDYGTDARLVSALAAEAIGAQRADHPSLQLALLRRFIGRTDAAGHEPRRKRSKSRKGSIVVPAHSQPAAVSPALPTEPGPVVERPSQPVSRPQVAEPVPVFVRPDPAGFAHAVHRAADAAAEGWAGNRRAFICKVWELVRTKHPEWALSEIEFKCMLAEAHRTGLVVLANADLKDKSALKELQASAVVYKNTVWHYVRTEN